MYTQGLFKNVGFQLPKNNCYTLPNCYIFRQVSIHIHVDTQCTAPPLAPNTDIVNPAAPGLGFYINYILHITGNVSCPTGYEMTMTCQQTKQWSTTNSYCLSEYVSH